MAALVFDEGKQRHLGDWEGREPNTSNVTHTVTINMSFAISTAMTNKPVALNRQQLTEAYADVCAMCVTSMCKNKGKKDCSYTSCQLRDMIHWRRAQRKKRGKEQQV